MARTRNDLGNRAPNRHPRRRRDLRLPCLFPRLRDAARVPVLLDRAHRELVPFGPLHVFISARHIEPGRLILLESASRVRTALLVAVTAVREGRTRSVSSTHR